MVNYVIAVVNYVIAAAPSPLNFVIADRSAYHGYRAVSAAVPRCCCSRCSEAYPGQRWCGWRRATI